MSQLWRNKSRITFLNKRFKSQRNQSVNPGSFVNNNQLNVPAPVSKKQSSAATTVPGMDLIHNLSYFESKFEWTFWYLNLGNNTSLLVTHEKLNLKTKQGSMGNVNYSISSNSPTSFASNSAQNRNSSNCVKALKHREAKSYYSSLSSNSRSCVRKIPQNGSKTSVNAGLRPAPYFKRPLRNLNSSTRDKKVSKLPCYLSSLSRIYQKKRNPSKHSLITVKSLRV